MKNVSSRPCITSGPCLIESMLPIHLLCHSMFNGNFLFNIPLQLPYLPSIRSYPSQSYGCFHHFNIIFCSMFRVDDGVIIIALLRRFYPCRHKHIIQGSYLETKSSTLKPPCLKGRFPRFQQYVFINGL